MRRADRLHRLCSRGSNEGFSLIELALVIAIVGLMLGAFLVPLSKQVELRQLAAEQQAQRDVRDALIGFAMVNRRLPCPDNDGDGAEDLTVPGSGNGPCDGAGGTPDSGFLPFQTLGVPATDAWDRLYFYRVDSDYVLASTPGTPAPNPGGLDLLDTSGITVQDRNSARTLVPLTIDAAAVVMSTGTNGHGSTNLDGDVIAAPAAPPTLADEAENLDNNVNFVYRIHSGSRDDCSDTDTTVSFFCEFDDVLTWVPASLLKLRMVEAGAIP